MVTADQQLVEEFVRLAFAQGKPEHAQILLLTADAYRDAIHTELLLPEQKERGELLELVRSSISPDKISALVGQGRALSHDEVVKFALQ